MFNWSTSQPDNQLVKAAVHIYVFPDLFNTYNEDFVSTLKRHSVHFLGELEVITVCKFIYLKCKCAAFTLSPFLERNAED